MGERIFDGGWDGRKWIPGRLVVDDEPKKEPPPVKVTIPEPRCIVRQVLCYIRYEKPSDCTPNFGAYPAFGGSRLDCIEWAKAKGLEMNLSVFEAETENPDLRAKDFDPPGIYLIHEVFDQFNDPHHRVFRY